MSPRGLRLTSYTKDQNKLELLNSRVNVNEIYQREHLTSHNANTNTGLCVISVYGLR